MPHLSHVALTVKDLIGMERFYQAALGLHLINSDGETRQLGVGDKVLLELRHDPAAKPLDPHQSGLFHTAFLFPDQADLGRWLRYAAQQGIKLTGASDHGVSEALYLDDPEGNGIEIYWDRPETEWVREENRIEMFTRTLDLNALVKGVSDNWAGAPNASKIGHVHMQVGDLQLADEFFAGDLGLTQTFSASGGAWYGWNGYHHHLAGNVWNSQGSDPRDPHMTGLAEIVLNDPTRRGVVLIDPWGTRFSAI